MPVWIQHHSICLYLRGLDVSLCTHPAIAAKTLLYSCQNLSMYPRLSCLLTLPRPHFTSPSHDCHMSLHGVVWVCLVEECRRSAAVPVTALGLDPTVAVTRSLSLLLLSQSSCVAQCSQCDRPHSTPPNLQTVYYGRCRCGVCVCGVFLPALVEVPLYLTPLIRGTNWGFTWSRKA